MKKRHRFPALTLTLAFLFLVGCGSTTNNPGETSSNTPSDTQSPAPAESEDTSSEDQPVYGGTMTLYYTSDIAAYYDPTIGDNQGYNLWMEPLFTYDITKSDEYACVDTSYDYTVMTGQIAKDYEWDEAGATITVYLKDNVYFQDKEPYNGRQLVANDVKWTYDRALGIGSGYDTPYECQSPWSTTLYFIESIECPDDFTVVFHLSVSTELTLNTFIVTAMSIGGPEWDELTDAQQSSYEYACGTGPYILKELVAGQSVTLVKNENYYGTDPREGYEGNQLPYIDEINFVFVSNSTNTLVQFVAGDLDFIGGRTNVLNDSEAAQLAASTAAYYTKDFKGRAETINLRNNCVPFNDKRVRQALQNAIDLEAVMNDFYGLDLDLPGILDSSAYYAYTDWPDELTAAYEYNPDKAKQLLEEAGYGDGLTFTVIVSPDSNMDLYTYINSAYFAPLGITMQIESVSNFLEARAISLLEDDTRSTAGTGLVGNGVTPGLQSVKNGTIDGLGAIWNGDEVWAEMVYATDDASTLAEFYSMLTELDQYWLEAQWVCYMSGMTANTEYYSSRVHGLAESTRLYNPSLMATYLQTMWVTD